MTSKVLVAGSGVIGLRTALELLRKKVPVILRSSHHPLDPRTCSMGAGGLWMPYKCDDKRVDKWSKDTLDELLHLCSLEKEKSDLTRPLVEIVPTLYLTNKHQGPTVEDFKNFDAKDYCAEAGNKKSMFPEWTKDSRLAFQHLTIDMLEWQNHVLKLKLPSIDVMRDAGYSNGWLFRPPIVDAPNMLMSMLKEIQEHPLAIDVDVDMEGYESMKEMVEDATANGCDAVVNCTGLGSSKLCDDDTLIGGRGILLNYERGCARKLADESMTHDAAILTEDGPWGSSTNPAYIIPRGDVFVVGGTYYEGGKEATLKDDEREQLVQNASILGIDTTAASPVGEWAGFRPVRKTVRMEIDEELSVQSGVKVLHSYGHGGSGWTVYAGVAKDSVKMLGLDKDAN